MVVPCTVLWSVALKIGVLTKLGLFFPVVCFIYVFHQTLAEQLYHDKGLLVLRKTDPKQRGLSQKMKVSECIPPCLGPSPQRQIYTKLSVPVHLPRLVVCGAYREETRGSARTKLKRTHFLVRCHE